MLLNKNCNMGEESQCQHQLLLQRLNLEKAKAKDGEDPQVEIHNLNKQITALTEDNIKYRIAQNDLL